MTKSVCRTSGLMLAVLIMVVACQTRHEIKPIEVKTVHEVKPMHITIDVNIKVEKALDDFFGEIDQAQQEIYGENGDQPPDGSAPSTE